MPGTAADVEDAGWRIRDVLSELPGDQGMAHDPQQALTGGEVTPGKPPEGISHHPRATSRS
jgi:hypothetical protein